MTRARTFVPERRAAFAQPTDAGSSSTSSHPRRFRVVSIRFFSFLAFTVIATSAVPRFSPVAAADNTFRRAQFQVTVVDSASASQTSRMQPNSSIKNPTEMGVGIRPSEGTLPKNRAAEFFDEEPEVYVGTGTSRGTFEHSYYWAASGFCHRPLYFEEINLERHGYSRGILQPVVSGAHFFASIPLMPYKVVAHPARECVYTLGHYRPGTPAPRHWHRGPFRLDAGLAEAGVAVGMVFLVP